MERLREVSASGCTGIGNRRSNFESRDGRAKDVNVRILTARFASPGIDTQATGLKSGRAMWLRARQFEFQFPRPAMLMGIVNVTPDSFSDGGKFFDPGRAVEQALRLVEEGALEKVRKSKPSRYRTVTASDRLL